MGLVERDLDGGQTAGTRAEHVCAFARRHGETEVLVIAGRWFAVLAGDGDEVPVGPAWADTRLELGEEARGRRYRNLLDGRHIGIADGEAAAMLELADVFAELPLALLLRE